MRCLFIAIYSHVNTLISMIRWIEYEKDDTENTSKDFSTDSTYDDSFTSINGTNFSLLGMDISRVVSLSVLF